MHLLKRYSTYLSDDARRSLIHAALVNSKYIRFRAASRLGIPYSTLRKHLGQLDMLPLPKMGETYEEYCERIDTNRRAPADAGPANQDFQTTTRTGKPIPEHFVFAKPKI